MEGAYRIDRHKRPLPSLPWLDEFESVSPRAGELLRYLLEHSHRLITPAEVMVALAERGNVVLDTIPAMSRWLDGVADVPPSSWKNPNNRRALAERFARMVEAVDELGPHLARLEADAEPFQSLIDLVSRVRDPANELKHELAHHRDSMWSAAHDGEKYWAAEIERQRLLAGRELGRSGNASLSAWMATLYEDLGKAGMGDGRYRLVDHIVRCFFPDKFPDPPTDRTKRSTRSCIQNILKAECNKTGKVASRRP